MAKVPLSLQKQSIITSDELTGSSACIRLSMSATRTEALPLALTFGITPKANCRSNYSTSQQFQKSSQQDQTNSHAIHTRKEKSKCLSSKASYNSIHNNFTPRACEWLSQYARVSLYHHRLGSPIKEEK